MKKFNEIFIDKTKYGEKIQTSEYEKQGKHIIVDQGQAEIAVIQIEKKVYLMRYQLLFLETIRDLLSI